MPARRVKLKAFKKFEDTAEAVQSATALIEGKLSATMKKFLKKNVAGDDLKVGVARAYLQREAGEDGRARLRLQRP